MFSPLPWCFRRVISQFAPRTWMIYSYLLLRCGPEGICWPTEKEIAHDVGIGPRKVTPHLRELEDYGFVVMREHEGLRYYCLPDPVSVLLKLAQDGRMPEPVVASLMDDLEVMKPRKTATVADKAPHGSSLTPPVVAEWLTWSSGINLTGTTTGVTQALSAEPLALPSGRKISG